MARARIEPAFAAVLVSLLVSTNAQGESPLGFYVGAGGGRADLRIDSGAYLQCSGLPNCLDASDFGWTAFVGLQPHPVAGEYPLLGAELQYLDFGHAAQEVPLGQNSRRARGEALFATATFPLPRTVDLYGKVGVGVLQTKDSIWQADPNGCLDSNGVYCGFSTRYDNTAVVFSWGLGVEVKLSSLALRAEYVRFSAANGADLLSVALLWHF